MNNQSQGAWQKYLIALVCLLLAFAYFFGPLGRYSSVHPIHYYIIAAYWLFVTFAWLILPYPLSQATTPKERRLKNIVAIVSFIVVLISILD